MIIIKGTSPFPLPPSPLSPLVTGEVFSWGSGIYGQLGHGNLRDRFSPLMIGAPLRGIGITLVACHEYHSAAVAGKSHACNISYHFKSSYNYN